MKEQNKTDGVAAYRQNNRSVECLTREQLNDILEAFPRTSDAYTAAAMQLKHYNNIENEYNEPTVEETNLEVEV